MTSWYFSYNYQKECHIYECIIMIYVVGLENLFSKGFQKVSPLVELNKQEYVQETKMLLIKTDWLVYHSLDHLFTKPLKFILNRIFVHWVKANYCSMHLKIY